MRVSFAARGRQSFLSLAVLAALAGTASAQTLQQATNDQLLGELQRRLTAAPAPSQAAFLSGACATYAQGNGYQNLLTLQSVSASGAETTQTVVLDSASACTSSLSRYQSLGPQLSQAAEFSTCALYAQGNGYQNMLYSYLVKPTGEIVALATSIFDSQSACAAQQTPRG